MHAASAGSWSASHAQTKSSPTFARCDDDLTDSVIENPYVFRQTERDLVARGLFPEGRTPLSAVRDMLGSQSSKGIYFLRKSAMTQVRPAVWRAGGWTALETYPTPVRSPMLKDLFQRLRAEPDFAKRSALGKNAAADLDDALWCALVAATWVCSPTSLVWPPAAEEAITSEGWIWVPADCSAPVELRTMRRRRRATDDVRSTSHR